MIESTQPKLSETVTEETKTNGDCYDDTTAEFAGGSIVSTNQRSQEKSKSSGIIPRKSLFTTVTSGEKDYSCHSFTIGKAAVDSSKIIELLESVKSKIVEWETSLPENATEESQLNLESVIDFFKRYRDYERNIKRKKTV